MEESKIEKLIEESKIDHIMNVLGESAAFATKELQENE